MAETMNVRLLDRQSAHEVAYKLMQDIMGAEKKSPHGGGSSSNERADRAYMLTLYYECHKVVVGGLNPNK